MANMNPGQIAQQKLQEAATQQLIDAGYYPGYSNSLGGDTASIDSNPAIKTIMDKYNADQQALGAQIKGDPIYGSKIPGTYDPTAYSLSSREGRHGDGLMGQLGMILSNPIFQIATAAITAGQSGLIGPGFPSVFGSAASSLPSFSEAGNSIGNLFGDASLGSDIVGGVNGIKNGVSDFFSPVTNAISDAGDSISNLFNPSGAGSGVGGASTLDPAVTGARDLTSATASTPSTSGLFSGAPSIGAPVSGGGAAGGFVSDPLMTGISTGENAAETAGTGGSALPWLEGTSGAAPEAAGTLPWNGMSPAESNLLGNATSSAATAMNPSPGTLTGGGKMAPSIGGLFGSSPATALLSGVGRAGIGLLSNPNNKGFDAQINAGNQIQQDYQPFLQSGTAANTTLANLFGLNGADAGAQAGAQANFKNTPGYQFALQQGVAAQDASAAAKGNLLSGNQQKALTDYGQGLASNTYNQYVQNLENQASQGQAAAGGVATGQAGVANAQAGKSGAKANVQNNSLGSLMNSIFPQSSLQSLMQLFGGNAYA